MTAYADKDTLNAALADYPGCRAFLDGTGKLRTRHRPTVKTTRAEPGSVEFDAWYEALITGVALPTAKVVKLEGGVVPQSLGHAYKLLRDTNAWKDAAPKTRENQSRPLDALLKTELAAGMLWRDAPMSELTRAVVAKIIDRTPAYQQKQLLAILSKLCVVALNAEPAWMEYNPTLGIKAKRPASKWKPWSYASMLRFEAAYAYGTTARTVYELAKWLGVRRSDIATITWEQLGPDLIDGVMVEGWTFMPKKTERLGKVIFAPITDELRAALAHITERTGTVLKKQDGGQYVIHTLSGYMQDWTADIGLAAGHILHGIRKNMGHDAADSGATLNEGMALGGWSTPNQYLGYAATFEQKRGAVRGSNKIVDLRRKREELRLKKAG